MSTPIEAGVKKSCCKCGKEVSAAPRMKDRHGRYWCMPCGQSDRKRQIHVACGICEVCGDACEPSLLMEIGGKAMCAECRRKQFGESQIHGSGIFSSLKSMFRH
ncbi:MAG TPA: hypothetical protein VLJ39_22760 [Tepidisphaeraceae bacterium]|jgi:hypothetical protein|nr:hypothetical protein [Tepidisphaeraceae bacterium]